MQCTLYFNNSFTAFFHLCTHLNNLTNQHLNFWHHPYHPTHSGSTPLINYPHPTSPTEIHLNIKDKITSWWRLKIIGRCSTECLKGVVAKMGWLGMVRRRRRIWWLGGVGTVRSENRIPGVVHGRLSIEAAKRTRFLWMIFLLTSQRRESLEFWWSIPEVTTSTKMRGICLMRQAGQISNLSSIPPKNKNNLEVRARGLRSLKINRRVLQLWSTRGRI